MAVYFSSSQIFQVPPAKYDVFISFRGSDIRSGFLSHLRERLRLNLIDVYVDEMLVRGEEISKALEQAIERSMISLVIFSKDYASSKWCLEELVKIMDCRKTTQQVVVPIFYNIDPSDVRHQTGSYAYAFAKYEEKLENNTEKLKIWKSTLNKAAKLSGYHYPSSNFRNESELISGIVNDTVKKLEDKKSRKSKDSKLHGVYQNLAEAVSSIKIEPQLQFNGLWGSGGNGERECSKEKPKEKVNMKMKLSSFKIPKADVLSAMMPRTHSRSTTALSSEKINNPSSATVWDYEDITAYH